MEGGERLGMREREGSEGLRDCACVRARVCVCVRACGVRACVRVCVGGSGAYERARVWRITTNEIINIIRAASELVCGADITLIL